MGDEVEEDPLEPAAVLWDIPISIARVDVESVADVFDPKNKKKQEQLLDHVSLWSQNLSASLSELLAWKDDCFELKALPLNMLSQLAIIMSRLVREKGEMIPPLHQALEAEGLAAATRPVAARCEAPLRSRPLAPSPPSARPP